MANFKRVFLKNSIYYNLEQSEYERVKKDFTLPNPAYRQAKDLGVSLAGIESTLSYIEYVKDTSIGGKVYRVPRYFQAMSPTLGKDTSIEVVDGRSFGAVSLKNLITPGPIFNNLRPHQVSAMEAYLNQTANLNGTGIIALACGKGKTITALALMNKIQYQTLILVDQLSLAKQWRDQILTHLGFEAGFWIQEKKEIKAITIATLQSLVSHDESGKLPEGFFQNFGMTILDECHVAPAWTFNKIMMNVTSQYVLGLSATVERADGLTKAVYAVCGPVVYSDLDAEVDPEISFVISEHVPTYISNILKWAERTPMDETFKEKWLKRQWPKFLTSLTEHAPRNRIILDLITKDAQAGHSILVLTGRKEHAKYLCKKLQDAGIAAEFVISECTAKQRELIFSRVKDGTTKVLLATSIAKKGLDIPNLSCVHLVSPVASKEFVIQGIGRALRLGPDKMAPIVKDYVDVNIDSAFYMAKSRARTYRSKGWKTYGEDKINQTNKDKDELF